MARSLNKVQLIGNLTRDPELRYTPQGTAVCTIGLATNREWKTEAGEKKEDVEFHRLVAWNKLAEICANLLKKGRKIYAEGRLQTRSWQAQDGAQRTTTEIVISDMIILDPKRDGDTGPERLKGVEGEFDIPEEQVESAPTDATGPEQPKDAEGEAPKEDKKSSKKKGKGAKDSEEPEDIPF